MIARPRTTTWTRPEGQGYMLCTVEQDEFTVSLALSDLSRTLDARGEDAAIADIEAQCNSLLNYTINREMNDRP